MVYFQSAKGNNRSSSASAYLSPVESARHGWLTLVSHRATKIVLSGSAPNVRATGVEFKSTCNTGNTFTANARLEVILAAGAIHSPQLLQLSGIGDPTVLKSLEINPFVNLKTVGRNLQEQTMSTFGHSAKSSFNPEGLGPSNCIAFPSIDQLFRSGAGANTTTSADAVKKQINTMYPTWAISQAMNAMDASALTTIFQIQAELIVNKSGEAFHYQLLAGLKIVCLTVPVIEMFYDTGYPEYVWDLTWHRFFVDSFSSIIVNSGY